MTGQETKTPRFSGRLGAWSMYAAEKLRTATLIAFTLIASILVGLGVTGQIPLGKTGFQLTLVGGAIILLGGAPLGLAALYAFGFVGTWFNIGTPGLTFLRYLGPWMGLFIFVLGIVILSRGRLGLVLRAIKSCWGFPFLIAYVVSGLILAPVFYLDDPVEHIGWTFVITLAVMCLSVVITLPAQRVFKFTTTLLLLAFAGVFALFVYFTFVYRGTEYFYSIARGGMDLVRVNRVVGSANDSAAMLIVLLPFATTFLSTRKRAAVLLWGVLLLSTYFVYRTFTRMAWISLPISLATYLWILNKRRLVFGLAIFCILVAIFLPAARSLYVDIAQAGSISPYAGNTLATRIYGIWLPMIQHTVEAWQTTLIGSGDAAYYISPVVPLERGMPVMPHNLWVDRFFSRGILGLCLWLFRMLAVLVGALRASLPLPAERRTWLAAGVASWVGYNMYALSANAQVDMGVMTNVLAGVCMWAYARLQGTERPASPKVAVGV